MTITNSSKNDMGLNSETPKLDEPLISIGEELEAGGSITLAGNITPAHDGKTPDSTEMRKNRNRWLKRKLKLGTWNIRSMAAGKLNTIIEEAKTNNVDILGVAEHRWAGSGHFTTNCGGQFMYSGREIAGQSGVGVFLSKAIVRSLIGYKPVNDRIITIRLLGQVKNITLIQVYAPTSASTEEELEEFYDALQKEIDSKENQDILVVSGDLNAKVGSKRHTEEDGIVGNVGLGERNDRGIRLVDFAISNHLAIKNTMFEKHPRRLYTWTSPDGVTKNQIDYIMIEKRWASSIQDVTTKPSADCDTDHEFLVATFKVKLKCKKITARPVRYDVQEMDENFNIEVRNRFRVLLMNIEEKEPDEIANETKSIYVEAAQKHLRKRLVKRQPWLTEETLQKVKQRKEAKKTAGAHSNDYKAIAKEVRQMCRKDKTKYLIRKCQKIDEFMKENKSRDMYNEIKSITRTFKPRLGVIKDESGKILTEAGNIVDRWKRYCEGMFTSNVPTAEVQQVRIEDIEDKEDPCLPPLKSEVEWAIKSLKDAKSPGCDKIQAEMIKASGLEGIEVYHKLCTKIWQTGQWPTDWKRAIFIALPKKGDLQQCSTYRTISLISHASKILLKIIMRRIESKIEEEVNKTQAGFRKNRGTRDHIFNLRMIVQKYREMNTSLHTCFIDYSKAFDSINHGEMWNTLKEMNFDPKSILLIRSLYEGQQSAVQLECGTTDWFPITRGVRQGCILSPHLFSIYTEGIMREVEHDHRNEEYDEPTLQGVPIRDLRYADDIALLATTPRGLEALIQSVKYHSEQRGLHLNVKKTKIMDIDKCKEEAVITINGEEIERVNNFVYLGARIDANGKSTLEIRRSWQWQDQN